MEKNNDTTQVPGYSLTSGHVNTAKKVFENEQILQRHRKTLNKSELEPKSNKTV